MTGTPGAHQPVRTILVTPNRGVGREILRRRALDGPGWVGVEHATPISLAQDLIGVDLALAGLSPLDELEQRAIVDAALDAALAGDDGRLAALGEGVGFRDAVANAIEGLRLAGVTPAHIRAAGLEDPGKQRALAAVLESYEAALDARARVDQADVLRRAIAHVEAHGLAHVRVDLLPGLRSRGLAGRFVEALRTAGAQTLPAPPIHGLEPPGVLSGDPTEPTRLSWLHDVASAPAADEPAIDLFAGGSPTDELREALRRVIAAGRRWDEVEIVATDSVAYGCALDALATRLRIPVTYAVGLPVERTRQGRAARVYLDWLQGAFPSEPIRLFIQSGDLVPPGEEPPSGERLARRLRRLHIGWGRERWLATLDRSLRGLQAEPDARPDDEHGAEELEARRARALAELAALRDLFGRILEATPRVPDRLGKGAGPISPAELARGLRAFLAHVPAHSGPEKEAAARLAERLDRVAERLDRKTSFGGALVILRSELEIRVPSPGTEGPLPWSSTGGALHFTDLDHGGHTGRPLTFVVGLDAERFPGAGLQDPILLDADRARLSAADLPASAERLAERRWALAAALARLRGTVSFSWAAWSGAEGRAVAPASEVLQAHRLRTGDPGADYEDLRQALGPLACPVPHGAARLDSTDVWLGALSRGGILLSGVPAVRRAWPDLDRGLTAADARRSAAFTAWDGKVDARPADLDPRLNPDIVLSPSALQRLGACPLAYLHSAILGIKAPRDPELDPDLWLDPLQRGSLLHAVYETALQKARELDVEPDSPSFLTLAQATLEAVIARFREAVPVPSDVVLAHEIERLETDVLMFVEMTREDVASGARWIDLEKAFGYGEGGDPIDLPVDGGKIRTRGRIDRIDRLPDGRLRVVDYKTGGTFRFKVDSGVFEGGRRLQHVVYARAATVLYEAAVARMEYHFPTVKAKRHRAVYTAADYARGAEVVGRLLDLVANGAFVPTDEKGDCRFCDHRAACRVEFDKRGGVASSPPAAWSAGALATLAEGAPFLAVRRMEKS